MRLHNPAELSALFTLSFNKKQVSLCPARSSMEALLASPSSYSSPESNASSSFDSPRLPDLESPVRFGQHDIFTPSSISSVTQEVPAWLDEDLEEEWVEHEASHSTSSPNSRLFSPNVERFGTVKTFSSAASSRRPSGLRHVLSDSSLRNIDQQEVGSAAGSLVVKSLDSVAQAAAAPAHSPKQPSQLELAARAIKGKQGGIGSPAQMSASQSIGLLKLFEPPSPPESKSGSMLADCLLSADQSGKILHEREYRQERRLTLLRYRLTNPGRLKKLRVR